MKLTFRPFKECDAAAVASWITDEPAMRLWSADRYERFPLAAADICRSYAAEAMNDCFIAFTLLCDDTVAGHVVMVHPGGRRDAIRLVYTIVDPRRRGLGLGQKLLQMAMDYAYRFMAASEVMIGVFESNISAMRCYRAAGFEPTGERFTMPCGEAGERPCIMLSAKALSGSPGDR